MKISYSLILTLMMGLLFFQCKEPDQQVIVPKTNHLEFSQETLNSQDSVQSDYLFSAETVYNYIHSKGNCSVLEIGDLDAYNKEHIPFAIHIDLRKFMKSTNSIYGGKALESSQIAKYLSLHGVRPNFKIILYDKVGGYLAHKFARILRFYGHENVAVLNGGMEAWNAQSYDVSNKPSGLTYYGQFAFRTANNIGNEITFDELKLSMKDENTLIIDCRSEAEFKGIPFERDGEIFAWEKGAVTFGRIPNAVHLSWDNFIDDNGRIKSYQDILDLIQPYDIENKKKVILYSHSAARSSLVNHVLSELLGYSHVKHYVGAWEEYSIEHKRNAAVKVKQELTSQEHSQLYTQMKNDLK